MNTFFIIGIGALGVGATIQYFLGMKKNRWLSGRLSSQAEEVFHPANTEYVNIGGTIGYNFTYRLREPWRNAKGTFTFFPRHSLLYMPISLVIGGSDRYYVNIFTEKRLLGEGHIVEKKHLRRAKIDDLDQMQREEIQQGGKSFVLLWRHADLREKLAKTLAAMPDVSILTHFCCYDDNKTFFLYLKPKKGEIAASLKKFEELAGDFFK